MQFVTQENATAEAIPMSGEMADRLESHMNALIATDVRPPEERDTFQVGAGQKRTDIVSAHVMPIEKFRELAVGEPVAGATTIKQVKMPRPASIGSTTFGKLLMGTPMLMSAIRQGSLADCFVLAAMVCGILRDPNWSDKNFIELTLDDGTPGIGVLYLLGSGSNAYVLMIVTTYETSLDFNNPHDADIRPELFEKTYGFARKGIADMHAADWGSGSEGLQMLHGATVRTIGKTLANIKAAGDAKLMITFATWPAAKILPFSHCMVFTGNLSADGQSAEAINPWDATARFWVTAATLASTTEIGVIYTAAYPDPPTIIKPQLPPPSPQPIPGDANGDGFADFNDFIILANNYGKPTTQGAKAGDFNGDGTVTFADFTILANNYNARAGALPADFPPEEKPMQVMLKNRDFVLAESTTISFVDGLGQCRLTWTTDPGVTVTVRGSQFQQPGESTVITDGEFITNFTKPCVLTLTFTKGAEIKAYTIAFVKETAPAPTKKPQFILYEDRTWAPA